MMKCTNKFTNDVLCVVMTHNREHLLWEIKRQIKYSTVPCDITIWNNGNNLTCYDQDIHYYHGRNESGMIQRFLPALIYPHKYVFFVDDDVFIGKKFVENAINIIEKQPRAIVTTLGSVMNEPVSAFNINRRVFVYGMEIKNKDNIHLDIGCLGCAVMLRKHVQAVFRSGFIPYFFCEDILFYMSHTVYNNGLVILSRHDEPDYMGIRRFQPDHKSGLVSKDQFHAKRSEQFALIADTLRWSPSAQDKPEWRPGGEAYDRLLA